MTIDDIKRLIAPDEHRTLELKKSTGELKDGMHSACAFLNTDGGWLIFGIAPVTLKIVGQQVTDNTQREIAQALSHIYPAVDCRVEYVDVPGQNNFKVIAMHFDCWAWGKEPYTYHGCPYYRVESTTKEMPRPMYDERLKAAQPHKFGWEKLFADGFSADDIDRSRLMSAVRMGVDAGRISPTAIGADVNSILGNFNLIKDDKIKNAAIMLFGKNTNEYPQLLLRLARFKGIDKNEFLDNKRVYGNFFDLIDAGMEFAYNHLKISGKVIGLHREDKLEIPVTALREALVNAFCHRIYDLPSQSVGLSIYDDRVEIENPGRFPQGLTAENIKSSHKSQPYNQLIAEVLYKTSWLESWGTGVSRMINACKEQNVPEPYYITEQGYITVVFPKSTLARKDCGIECGIQLTERQMNILEEIEKDGRNTAKDIAGLVGIGLRSAEGELSFLRKHGFIEKETKDNRSPWVVLKKE